MSYLSDPTSKTEYGVVKVGNYIDVDTYGVISLSQDLSATANVTFHEVTSTTTIGATGDIVALGNISGTQLLDAGKRVITTVTPTAGTGISVTGITSSGPSASFTVANTGVLSLTAGTGISLSASTGSITVSVTGTSYINVTGVTSNYTPTLTDEYVGVKSASAVTITLPTGVEGRVYIIKDEYGQGSGKITIRPPEGVKIDNSNSYIISVPFQSIQVVYRSGAWWII